MGNITNPVRLEYLSHLEKQKKSGLNITKYCEKNNLIEHKFRYYRACKMKMKKTLSYKGSFSSVKLKSSSESDVEVKKITPQLDPQWLAQFTKNLLSLK